MAWAECAGRSFAVNIKGPRDAVGRVRLHLASVVRDVKQEGDIAICKEAMKHSASNVTDDFAIGQGAIDGGAHGAEITLSRLRPDWDTGQFTVRQVDAR